MKPLREALTLSWLLSTIVAMRACYAAVERARRHYAQSCESHDRALAAWRTIEYERAHEGRRSVPRFLVRESVRDAEAVECAIRG